MGRRLSILYGIVIFDRLLYQIRYLQNGNLNHVCVRRSWRQHVYEVNSLSWQEF